MTQTPAGWFPDPQTPGLLRYWDGSAWTAHVQGAAQPPPPTVDGAVLALVLGILSIAASCVFVTGIPAMIIGRRAVRQVDESQGRLGGRALAQVGFWTGLAGTVLGLLAVAAVAVVLGLGASGSFDTYQETCTEVHSDGTVRDC